MALVSAPIRTARRVDRFTYAIRNIVTEAKKVELAGTTVRYLNIGDPEPVRVPDAAASDRSGRTGDAGWP